MHHQGDGPASSLGCVSMGKEQCAVASLLKLKLWLKSGELAAILGQERRGGLASSAQHHQGVGPASSLGRLSMGTEQRAVVVFLKSKSILRSIFCRWITCK